MVRHPPISTRTHTLIPSTTLFRSLVTTADRQEKLLSGEIDTVCGPFSITESRMADFDFSFLIFVSGGSVAARRPSSVIPAAPQAMQGALQRVAVVSETTTLEFIESLLGTSVAVDRKATPDEAFAALAARSDENPSELQSLMRISYAVFCWK